MKKRIFSTIIAMILIMSTLVGCGNKKDDTDSGSGSDSGKVEVGIVLPTKDEPRWLQDQTQFESILKEAGFTNQVLFSQGNSATEKTNVETLISKGIKVLIICAQDGKVAGAAVEAAKAAGVTVIAYDRLITDTDAVDYYVTFDSVAVGAAQGQYLIDNAPAGKSNVPLYLYAGASTDNNAFLFFQGAWNVLQPKIADGTFKIANSSEAESLKDKANFNVDTDRADIAKIIGQVTTNWEFNDAKSKAEANLTSAGADLKGDVLVLAPNDGTSRAIADTFGIDAAVTSYVITGQDSEKASVQYILDGKQSMTVFKDTRKLAADSVAMAVSILKNEKPATDTTYNNGKKDVPAKQTAIVTITKDNVKKELVDSGYYKESDFTGL